MSEADGASMKYFLDELNKSGVFGDETAQLNNLKRSKTKPSPTGPLLGGLPRAQASNHPPTDMTNLPTIPDLARQFIAISQAFKAKLPELTPDNARSLNHFIGKGKVALLTALVDKKEGRTSNAHANAFAALTAAAARLDRHSIPDDPTREQLQDIDRSEVMWWLCRRPGRVGSMWSQLASPEDRPSKKYKVIAQIMTG